MLAEAENPKRTGAEYAAGEIGLPSIAATHTAPPGALPADATAAARLSERGSRTADAAPATAGMTARSRRTAA